MQTDSIGSTDITQSSTLNAGNLVDSAAGFQDAKIDAVANFAPDGVDVSGARKFAKGTMAAGTAIEGFSSVYQDYQDPNGANLDVIIAGKIAELVGNAGATAME